MNKTLPILSLCVATLALAFTFAGSHTEAPPPPPSEPTGPRVFDEVLMLEKRVELLEDDQRKMWDRMVGLERAARLANDGGAPDPRVAEELTRLTEELKRSMLALSDPDAGRAVAAEFYREFAEAERRERSEQRFERMKNRAEARQEAWKEFAVRANLNSEQERVMNERFKLEADARERLRASTQPLGPDTLRELGTLRRETDKVMKQTLSTAQYEQYLTVRRDRSGGAAGGDRLRDSR